MALRRVGKRRRRARRAWRKGKRCVGWLADGGKRAGERRVGTVKRWTVLGGEEAMSCVRAWRMEGNGFSALGEILRKLMAPELGSVRRLVKSKLWQNGVGTVELGWFGLDGIGLRLGVAVAVDISKDPQFDAFDSPNEQAFLMYTNKKSKSRANPTS